MDVQSNAEFKEEFESQIDQLLALLYALLAISLIISLFGIVNALVLSIYERTREIGMLRAIGTTRRQMRSIVRYESIITAVIGGVLGILIGVFFAWILTRGLEDEGIGFSLPVLTLVVFLVAGRRRRGAGGGAAGAPRGAPQPAGGPPSRVRTRRRAPTRPSMSSSEMTSGGRKRTVRDEVLLAR